MGSTASFPWAGFGPGSGFYNIAEWQQLVRRQPLDRAARTVAGQLADRAGRDGRVCVTVAELAAACCLPVTVTADAVAEFASHGLLGRDGAVFVLTWLGGAR